jgi:TonB family protein
VSVTLARCAPTLAAVVVRASGRRFVGRLAGFEERRERGLGRFITRADIERLRPAHTSDILRTVPGVTVLTRDNTTGQGPVRPDRRAVLQGREPAPTVFDLTTRARIRLRGASCAPQFYLDGARLAEFPEVDVDAFIPASIGGIEIYAGGAAIPPQFAAPGTPDGGSRCGAIVLWTRGSEVDVRTPLAPDAAAELVRLVESAQVYTADEVDVRATLDTAKSPPPLWEDSLRAAGVGGRVVVELVVDADGDPELATLSVVSAAHPALIAAVRRAVGESQFAPATRGGRRVRQLVQQPYDFVAGPPAR